MAAEKQHLIFISYSRADKDFALELARELRTAGFRIWFDQLDIPTGSRWDDEVEKALIECEIFLIIITPNSIASNNVKDEIGYAIDTNKHIMPVLLQTANVPLRLRRFQYVDFTKKSHKEGIESAKQLLRGLLKEPATATKTMPPQPRQQASVEQPAQTHASSAPVSKDARPRPSKSSPASKPESKQTSSTRSPGLIPLAIGAAVLSILCLAAFLIVRPLLPAPTPETFPTSVETVEEENYIEPTEPEVIDVATVAPEFPEITEPAYSAPVIEDIDLPTLIPCDGSRYYFSIYFHDVDGDASLIDWDLMYSLLNTNLDSDPRDLDIESAAQIHGAVFEDWIEWYVPGDQVRIRVTIMDDQGLSGWKDFEFSCSN